MKFTMTFENFVRFATFFNGPAKYLVALLLCLTTFGTFAADRETDVFVGEVSLVIGKAFIDGPNRDRYRVKVGSLIMVNDQVVTEANGHVHIRFVDKALVSVRPNSRLEIVNYSYDPRQPEQSIVKFNLVEGVTRSISGDAAKSASDRFRLNTPIAAIGVRGTDFVVSASQQTVRALVNEGIIVIAPYSADCTAESFGPCTVNAVELSSDSLQILELNAETPTAIPASLERDPSIMQDDAQLLVTGTTPDDDNEQGEQSVSGEVYRESVTSVKVADAEQIVAEPEVEAPAPDPIPIPIPDFTPVEPVPQVVLTDRQLLWGRWAWSDGQGDLERISIATAEAAVDRRVTIGNAEYGLFRVDETGLERVDKGLGEVIFALSSAQAFYHSDSGVMAMQVNGGSLSIDFDKSTFATELNLYHMAPGNVDIIAKGRIYSGGYFYARSDTQNVVGAVSLDGKEAGYFFDQQLKTGGIQGLTLWDSQ